MIRILAALCLALATLAAPAVAQDRNADVTDMQALRAAMKADRRAFVAATLALSDAEAKRFWPVYEQYQADVAVANRMRAVALQGLLSRDKPITDLYAKQLARELVASDEGEVKARRAMYSRVMRALPATKAARYLQLESKIRALQNYDIAVAFPLIK
jgi:hypothetical protein